MMKIQLTLYGLTVRKRLEDGAFVEVDEDASVHDLLRLFGFREEEIGLVVVNGKSGDYRQILGEGDRVTLIAPLAGG